MLFGSAFSQCGYRSRNTESWLKSDLASMWLNMNIQPTSDFPFAEPEKHQSFFFSPLTIVCCEPGKVSRRLCASSTEQLQTLHRVYWTKTHCVDLTATAVCAERWWPETQRWKRTVCFVISKQEQRKVQHTVQTGDAHTCGWTYASSDPIECNIVFIIYQACVTQRRAKIIIIIRCKIAARCISWKA